jgi:putative salt-induced outer membrane protein
MFVLRNHRFVFSQLSLFMILLSSSLTLMAQSSGTLTNESEAGVAAANGNTKTQTFTIKQANDYKWDAHTFGFRSRYLNASANSQETARFFQAGLRYDRILSGALSTFVGGSFEKDKFAGIDQRRISDLGGKYRFIESDTTKLFSELGYRYMHEKRLDDSVAYSHYARFYSEWENKWNENFSTKYWIEYLPNITEKNDWQLNTELSFLAVLSSMFSLKSGFLMRYDQLPAPGIQHKTDTLITTALVAKF